MPISVGRTVHFKLDQHHADAINSRNDGGNRVEKGDVFPMVVVRMWGPASPEVAVNGKVELDGPGSLWVTSVCEGTHAGQWSWPPRD